MAKVCDINKMSDLEIRDAILRRDNFVTKEFFYKRCYYKPFKSIFDNYYTNCKSCKEFIDEIYILILTPGKKTKKCQLENFNGESTLKTWLRSVCLYYCYGQFRLAERDPIHHAVSSDTKKFDDGRPLCSFIFNTISEVKGIDEKYCFCSSETIIDYLPNNIHFLKKVLFIYLTTPCSMWDPSFLTRGPTLAPCTGNTES